MAELIQQLTPSVRDAAGARFKASVYADRRQDGLWEGWLEFRSADSARVLRTNRETVQSSEREMVMWASGLEPVYLEGAFQRATR